MAVGSSPRASSASEEERLQNGGVGLYRRRPGISRRLRQNAEAVTRVIHEEDVHLVQETARLVDQELPVEGVVADEGDVPVGELLVVGLASEGGDDRAGGRIEV
jgi:hypothetical protein